jgi:hypothetical protein
LVADHQLQRLLEECSHDCITRMQIASGATEELLGAEQGPSVFHLASALLDECRALGLGSRHAARLGVDAVLSCHAVEETVKSAAAAVHMAAVITEARGSHTPVSSKLDMLDRMGYGECALGVFCMLAKWCQRIRFKIGRHAPTRAPRHACCRCCSGCRLRRRTQIGRGRGGEIDRRKRGVEGGGAGMWRRARQKVWRAERSRSKRSALLLLQRRWQAERATLCEVQC